jgi:hypothetical protein
VLEVVKKAGDAFDAIINDPIGFIGNLVQAVRKGFQQFADNILTHLKVGLTTWLFGALSGAGLRLPEKFDLRGILSLVLQILGLTYERLRGKLVALIGPKKVAFLEEAFAFLKILVTQGLAAAWQKLVEYIGSLQEMVLGAIRDWVVTKIVTAAVTKLISMFNPAGAIIQAIIAVYNTVVFFIERFNQILDLANAVLDSIVNIAAGKLDAAANYVEKTMAKTIPVILGFLARLIGLGDVSEKIRGIIASIQAKVDQALTKLVQFLVEKGKALFGSDKEGKPDDRTEQGKKADVHAAVTEAERAADEPGASPATVRAQLPAIQSRYRLASLALEQLDGTTYRVHGKINPEEEGPAKKLEGGEGADTIHVDAETEPDPSAAAGPAAGTPTPTAAPPSGEAFVIDAALRAELVAWWKSRQLVEPAKAATYAGYITRLNNLDRPTPAQAEEEIAYLRGAHGGLSYRTQISYQYGREAEYGGRGTVRPDVSESTTGFAIEVKRYLIKNRSSLISKVVEQIEKRRERLPYDMHAKQAVVVDLRGQKVSDAEIARLKQDLAAAAKLAITNIEVVIYET